MKKIIVTSLALALAGCGPSEEEIQARIDKEVAQKVETLKAEMKAERAAEKAAELEAAAAAVAEAKRKAEEKAAEDARLAHDLEEKRKAELKAARIAQETAAEKDRLAKAQKAKQSQIAAAWKREAEIARFKKLQAACQCVKIQGNEYTVTSKAGFIGEETSEGDLNKIISILEIPQSIILKINNTRPIQGVVQDEFRGIKVSWVLEKDGIADVVYLESWTFVFKISDSQDKQTAPNESILMT